MKVYRGQHRRHDPESSPRIFVIDTAKPEQPAYELHHLVLHSPTGLTWGYHGSGPADLALSILADHFNERPTKAELEHGNCRCWHLHQTFKDSVIARQPMGEDFYLTSDTIESFLDRQRVRLAEIDEMLQMRRAAGAIDPEPAEA